MKTFLKIGIVVLILGAIVAAAYQPAANYWRKRNLPNWREDEVVRGDIVSVVNSTGTVKPVMSVQVGAFVSGPIDPDTPLVEFNSEVKKDDVLAVIDQRIYEADVARDTAAVEVAQAAEEAATAGVDAAEAAVEAAIATKNTRLAEMESTRAQLNQAQRDEARGFALADRNRDFISQSEMDSLRFGRMSLDERLNVAKASVAQADAAVKQAQASVAEAKASLTRAKASIAQAKANKMRSELNLGYTIITSPVDGIVIDRKIEPGQTLVAAFQTPEVFVVAPNMREEMYVNASVDEADIGLIRDAQQRGNPVEFTVDAYPNDLFRGEIKEVRFSSTTTQNVVTYPVIVAAANPDLKLLPGMTASISFQIQEKKNVLKIPNSALRFYPMEQHVRKEDRKILEGASLADENDNETLLSASEKSEAARSRNRRHVWVFDGDYLKAVEVIIGISDSKYTEVVSGELKEDMKLVTGVKPTA